MAQNARFDTPERPVEDEQDVVEAGEVSERDSLEWLDEVKVKEKQD